MKSNYENSLFYQIHLTAKFFDKLFEQYFKEINLGVTSVEHLALSIISEKQNCCQRDLAKIILKDRANTGKLANSLESRGLIEIVLSQKNNRPVKILKITDKGRELLESAYKKVIPVVNHIYSKFQESELEEVKATLHNFRKTVQEGLKTNI